MNNKSEKKVKLMVDDTMAVSLVNAKAYNNPEKKLPASMFKKRGKKINQRRWKMIRRFWIDVYDLRYSETSI